MQLVYLERVCGEISALIDLDYLCSILKENRIAIEIDFENNKLYYNKEKNQSL